MRIVNYGHACFKIIDDDLSIIFDPYQDNSVPGMNLSNNLEANYVFSSHDHFDHDATSKVKIIKTDKKIDLKEFVIPHDKEGGRKRGMNVARLIKFSTYSICHLGDIGDPNSIINIDELKNIDIVLCPINGFFTIGAKEAIDLKKKMNWKLLIPMHYHIASDNSGYPDGEQIEIFKSNIQHFDLDSYYLDVDENIFKNETVIFNQRKGD